MKRIKWRKILIWVPLLALFIVFFSKNLKGSVYYEYFDYGTPWLVIINILWQGISSFAIFTLILNNI